MRRRYLCLVAAPGLTEAHLLIYENEAKWAISNPPSSSPSTTPSASQILPQLPLQAIEQFLQADDGSRKGAKYLVRLEGLVYAGVNQVSVNGRLSVTDVIKSALGKLMIGSSKSQDSTSSAHQHQHLKGTQRKDSHQHNKSDTASSEIAGSAESYISTTSTPGTLNDSTEISVISSQRPASICGIPSLNSAPVGPNSPNGGNSNSSRSPTSLGLYFQDGSSTLISFATPEIMEAWLQVLTAVVATNRSRSGYPNIGECHSLSLSLSLSLFTYSFCEVWGIKGMLSRKVEINSVALLRICLCLNVSVLIDSIFNRWPTLRFVVY
ncbi:unnamed protein product [Rodentolepis nana]|uniref:PH domain-containing protein n=1 Tax=Rodentolepis nana TaxID=102285 RepID=A0A0R3T686_RODNA|nr:unnamed protein product [Rodentolepis nana]